MSTDDNPLPLKKLPRQKRSISSVAACKAILDGFLRLAGLGSSCLRPSVGPPAAQKKFNAPTRRVFSVLFQYPLRAKTGGYPASEPAEVRNFGLQARFMKEQEKKGFDIETIRLSVNICG